MKSILAKFSTWHPWAERADLDLRLPGVYLLARFQRRPTLGKPALSRKICYIGETCRPLKYRLYSFNRSGLLNKVGHSGGATFYKTFKHERGSTQLFVSAFPVDLPPLQSEAYVRFVERALLWSYVAKYKVMPSCNRK